MSVLPQDELIKMWESEQEKLKLQVLECDTEEWQRASGFTGLQRVAGVDLSFIKGDDAKACAQLVVLSYPQLELLYADSQMVALGAPYIAGFLAFRETPHLLDALRRCLALDRAGWLSLVHRRVPTAVCVLCICVLIFSKFITLLELKNVEH